MTNQLKGKIYWVLDDFAYLDTYFPKEGETYHTAQRIDNVTIDEHMIKLFVPPFEFNNEQWSYNVNLTINESGNSYAGSFTEDTNREHTGEVTCELFSNQNKYFLYGRWVENDMLFTWWAVINKDH